MVRAPERQQGKPDQVSHHQVGGIEENWKNSNIQKQKNDSKWNIHEQTIIPDSPVGGLWCCPEEVPSSDPEQGGKSSHYAKLVNIS